MITAQRAVLLLTGAAMAVSASPALAQVPESVTLNIMRECAKIDDPTARLACYDNNIRAAGANPNSIPGRMGRPGGGGACSPTRTAERLSAPTTCDQNAGAVRSLSRKRARTKSSTKSPRSRNASPALPGHLDSGAQWLISEGVGRNSRAAAQGQTPLAPAPARSALPDGGRQAGRRKLPASSRRADGLYPRFELLERPFALELGDGVAAQLVERGEKRLRGLRPAAPSGSCCARRWSPG